MHDRDSDFVLALESDINNQAPMCGLILGYSGDHVPSKFIDPLDRAATENRAEKGNGDDNLGDYVIARGPYANVCAKCGEKLVNEDD
jgi:hypothetical protein